jgi:hypothetical protein
LLKQLIKLLPGRTNNSVKNHFHSYTYHLKKGTKPPRPSNENTKEENIFEDLSEKSEDIKNKKRSRRINKELFDDDEISISDDISFSSLLFSEENSELSSIDCSTNTANTNDSFSNKFLNNIYLKKNNHNIFNIFNFMGNNTDNNNDEDTIKDLNDEETINLNDEETSNLKEEEEEELNFNFEMDIDKINLNENINNNFFFEDNKNVILNETNYNNDNIIKNKNNNINNLSNLNNIINNSIFSKLNIFNNEKKEKIQNNENLNNFGNTTVENIIVDLNIEDEITENKKVDLIENDIFENNIINIDDIKKEEFNEKYLEFDLKIENEEDYSGDEYDNINEKNKKIKF